jgi:diguanylate cyclase (GGDEF)-like protein
MKKMKHDKKILIVDDDQACIDSMQKTLGDEYETHVATSVAEALKLADGLKPDIVFLDIVLPDGEGYELCSSLKRSMQNQPLQIVLMSDVSDSDRMERILAVGADDFIKKPFEDLEFRLRLKAALIRLRAQEMMMDEREFYRQAVRQEENLTIKLLDRQQGLKETLVDLAGRKAGMDHEDTSLSTTARYDVLTGLLNRHSLYARLELEAKRSIDEGLVLCGMMIEIGGLKEINDSLGHTVGDELLRAAGDALHSCLRREDFAGRYGGDSFFVILPGSGLDEAQAIARRIVSTVKAEIVSCGELPLSPRVTVGVAAHHGGDTVAIWVDRAEAAMRRSKSPRA